MTQNVHLNGGPWHGKTIAIEDGRDHVHILQPVEDALREAITKEITAEEAQQGLQRVPIKEGMYSQVRGCPGEYEWDGWRSHD